MNVQHRTSNVQHRITMSLRSAINIIWFTISDFFQPFDSAQGREPVNGRFDTRNKNFNSFFSHSTFGVGRSMFIF